MMRRERRDLVLPDRAMQRKSVDEKDRRTRALVAVGHIDAVDWRCFHGAAPCSVAGAFQYSIDGATLLCSLRSPPAHGNCFRVSMSYYGNGMGATRMRRALP